MSSRDAPATPASWSTSPTHQFIQEVVEPQRENFNTYSEVLTTRGILLTDAKKRRKVAATKLSPPDAVPSYRLTHAGHLIGGIDGKYTTAVSQQARLATLDRGTLREYLAASHLPVRAAQTFLDSRREEGRRFALSAPNAVSLRPVSRRARPPFPVEIHDVNANFSSAWESIVAACNTLRTVERQIAIEHVLPGVSLRFFVVGERAIAAVARVPFYVVGDGISSTRELVDAEMTRRGRCAYLKKRSRRPVGSPSTPGDIGDDAVPPKKELVVLAPETQPGTFISVDVRDIVDDSLVQLALDAMWAFPGLTATAVDISSPSIHGREGATVTDVNPGSDISEFLYPAYGAPRKVGLAVLDHMIAAAGR
ncbi:hypothetical protein [Nesterenkonia lutea]|uniref:ATP-grasp domain-containing protein n=1 Tax=Nesterenkonia lutea TaxID=272919 RepID=A0ABR9JC72_9MICC|nr:hypothetical protein [Nesterenkonia lutea]MBE1523406.1 hypothetical protein [Nesterenkonia lutea]